MPRPVIGVWVTTAIWVLATAGLWGTFELQVRHGTELELRAVPVDPRDVLRGDFVVLRYRISTAERPPEQRYPWPYGRNQVVFATLEQDGDDWKVAAVDHRPPAEGLFLRGRVQSTGEDRLELLYGIESFFVPEGEGTRYEEARNRERLWAVAAVSPHGVARLKRLEIR